MSAPAAIPPAEADIVVIGAGAFGYSTAYFLAKHGAGRVVLLDKGTPGDGSSAKAAGLFKMVQADETLTRLSHRSAAIVKDFETETGVPLPSFASGSILAARTHDHAALIKAEIAQSLEWGVELEVVDHANAKRIAPYLDPVSFTIAVHVPGDRYIEEPAWMLAALHRAAEERGVTIGGHAPVTGITVRNGEVAGVTTPGGAVAAPVVVDAAGAWARQVGGTAGEAVPLVPVRHQFAISDPAPGILAGWPITRIIDASAYVRPMHGGLMYGNFERHPVAIEPGDWSISELPLDPTVPAAAGVDVSGEVPAILETGVSEIRGGLLTMTPDARFLAGPAPGIRGLWLNTGCNGSGFSFAPAIGEALAGLITAGESDLDIARFDPRRFADRSFTPEDLERDGLFQYANYYTPPDVAAAHGGIGLNAEA